VKTVQKIGNNLQIYSNYKFRLGYATNDTALHKERKLYAQGGRTI
jgi:hypothetical protein